MRIVENVACGKCGVLKIRGVQKMRSVKNAIFSHSMFSALELSSMS